MDESGADEAECSRKVTIGKKIASVIRSLVNAKHYHFECERVLHALLLAPVLTYGSETMIWSEIYRVVQMDNLRVLLDIRRIDKIPNARIRQLCGMTEGVKQMIDEGVVQL